MIFIQLCFTLIIPCHIRRILTGVSNSWIVVEISRQIISSLLPQLWKIMSFIICFLQVGSYANYAVKHTLYSNLKFKTLHDYILKIISSKYCDIYAWNISKYHKVCLIATKYYTLQIIHFLFPVDHSKLPHIYPLLEQTCKEFGVEYKFETWPVMAVGHFVQLARNKSQDFAKRLSLRKWLWLSIN